MDRILPPNYNPPPLPKKKKKNVFCPTLLSTNLVALNWFARGSKSLIHVHCVPSLVYCSSHGTYSPHPVILIACDFPNTKCFCICMEWWKLSARCNAEAGNSQGEEIEMQPIQTQQDQSSGVMEDTMMMKLYWDKPVELFLTVYFVEVVMTN